MELGACICTPQAPACPQCPLQAQCHAHARQEQHKGSSSASAVTKYPLKVRVACGIPALPYRLLLLSNPSPRSYRPHLPCRTVCSLSSPQSGSLQTSKPSRREDFAAAAVVVYKAGPQEESCYLMVQRPSAGLLAGRMVVKQLFLAGCCKTPSRGK